VAVRAGLQKVWGEPTAAAVEPGVYRQAFSDRELNGDTLQWLVDNGLALSQEPAARSTFPIGLTCSMLRRVEDPEFLSNKLPEQRDSLSDRPLDVIH
jgi:hypothetical protein